MASTFEAKIKNFLEDIQAQLQKEKSAYQASEASKRNSNKPLGQLNLDMHKEILRYLPNNEGARASAVCQFFYHASQEVHPCVKHFVLTKEVVLLPKQYLDGVQVMPSRQEMYACSIVNDGYEIDIIDIKTGAIQCSLYLKGQKILQVMRLSDQSILVDYYNHSWKTCVSIYKQEQLETPAITKKVDDTKFGRETINNEPFCWPVRCLPDGYCTAFIGDNLAIFSCCEEPLIQNHGKNSYMERYYKEESSSACILPGQDILVFARNVYDEHPEIGPEFDNVTFISTKTGKCLLEFRLDYSANIQSAKALANGNLAIACADQVIIGKFDQMTKKFAVVRNIHFDAKVRDSHDKIVSYANRDKLKGEYHVVDIIITVFELPDGYLSTLHDDASIRIWNHEGKLISVCNTDKDAASFSMRFPIIKPILDDENDTKVNRIEVISIKPDYEVNDNAVEQVKLSLNKK